MFHLILLVVISSATRLGGLGLAVAWALLFGSDLPLLEAMAPGTAFQDSDGDGVFSNADIVAAPDGPDATIPVMVSGQVVSGAETMKRPRVPVGATQSGQRGGPNSMGGPGGTETPQAHGAGRRSW